MCLIVGRSALERELLDRRWGPVRVGITTGFDGAAGDTVVIFGGFNIGLCFLAAVDSTCRVLDCLIGFCARTIFCCFEGCDGADV